MKKFLVMICFLMSCASVSNKGHQHARDPHGCLRSECYWGMNGTYHSPHCICKGDVDYGMMGE